jgi:hypothetical protein
MKAHWHVPSGRVTRSRMWAKFIGTAVPAPPSQAGKSPSCTTASESNAGSTFNRKYRCRICRRDRAAEPEPCSRRIQCPPHRPPANVEVVTRKARGCRAFIGGADRPPARSDADLHSSHTPHGDSPSLDVGGHTHLQYGKLVRGAGAERVAEHDADV